MTLNKTGRQQVLRLVAAFETTADALEAEKILITLPRTNANCGRLIPVPRNVSAGCGMAWKDEIELKSKIESALQNAGIEASGFYEISFSEKI